jgi:hypothetical protein
MPIRKSYKYVKSTARKDLKRRQAEDRQAKYDALPLAEKLKTMGKQARAKYDAKVNKTKKPIPAPVAVPADIRPEPAFVPDKKKGKGKKS